MQTDFEHLRRLTGLSDSSAAEYLGVRESTVRSWRRGRREAPPSVISALEDLAKRQEEIASRLLGSLDMLRLSGPVRVQSPGNNADAKAFGLPNLATWRRVSENVARRAPVQVIFSARQPAPTAQAA